MKTATFLSAIMPLGSLATPFYLFQPVLAEERTAAAQDGCVFPAQYTISNLIGTSNDTHKPTMSAFTFDFGDVETKTTTKCTFNEKSVNVAPNGGVPRYACEKPNIEFIYDIDATKLWLIERLCPGSDGKPQWEVSGSFIMPLNCVPNCHCQTEAAEYNVTYNSLNPIRD